MLNNDSPSYFRYNTVRLTVSGCSRMRQQERMSDVSEGPTEISRDNRKGIIPKVIEMMLWSISKIFGVLGHSMRALERERASVKTFYSINWIKMRNTLGPLNFLMTGRTSTPVDSKRKSHTYAFARKFSKKENCDMITDQDHGGENYPIDTINVDRTLIRAKIRTPPKGETRRCFKYTERR